MASGVLYRSLQAPTAVSAACCITSTTGAVVLQLQDTRLTCWRVCMDGLEQTASWRAPGSMLSMVHLPCGHLLLLAEGGQCYLHRWQQQHAAVGAAAPPLVAHAQLRVPVDSSSSHMQPYGCVVSSNALAAPTGQGMASLTAVVYMTGVLHVIKASPSPAGRNSSDTQGAATSSSAAAAAAAAEAHASPAGDSPMRLQTKAMALTHALLSCHYPGGKPPALAAVRVSCRVLGMAWLSPGEQQLDLQGRSLLAVLHEVTVASQPPVVNVDCLAVNWVEGTLSPGPWSLRNVHPTTRLLQPFPGTEQLPPGVLAISSRGVQLCTCLGGSLQQGLHDTVLQGEATSSTAAVQEAPAAAAAASSGLLADGPCVKFVEVVVWGLGGLPLSCVPLSDSCYVVGDSSAGLHMFSVSQGPLTPAAAWMRLLPSSCLAIPDVLVHAPFTQQQQQHSEAGSGEQQGQQQLSGLLLVGSKCSSSQVLGLSRACWEAATGSWPSRQGDCSLPVLQSALQPSVAGAQAVAVYQDPSGALPEQQLVVACGVSPRCKLAVVRSGCGLVPAMLDGPELPGDAQLFAIPQPQPCQHHEQQYQQQQQQQERCPELHSMLGFSFPSAGASSVMSLEGHTFRQLHLAGLQDSEASLLLTTAPGGWLLQVASSGVRVLDSSKGWQLCSQWTPTGGSISLAATHGSHLVVACGAHVTVLAVSCCSGAILVTATAELQQQASALSIFRLQGGQLMVAAGLWVDNSILLMPCPAAQAPQQQQVPVQLQVACWVHLDRDQPRSIALLPVGGADVLLAGSNTGKVLMWEVCSTAQQPQQGSAQPQLGVSLQHAQAVQVSNTSVSLQQTWLPDMQPGALHGSGESGCSGHQPPPVRCVIAHAGSMAVFKPNAGLLAALHSYAAAAPAGRNSLPATCCVQVCRLCGSEACLAAAPVHTPDMPHSLAWVSSTQRLCFGSIAAEHKLRWRSCGQPGTPLAVAVHEASDTLVLLLAADDFAAAEQGRTDSSSIRQLGLQQQRLVVLDARSLRTVMTLALAPGHTYTTLQVLDLPASSQQHQHPASDAGGQQRSCRSSTGGAGAAGMDSSQHGAQQQQQQQGGAGSPPGCLPFIVLGSHAVLATADTSPAARRHAAAGEIFPPRVKRVGVLSIFELKRSVVQAAAGQQQSEAATSSAAADDDAAGGGSCPKSELRYELVLHGMLPMQVAPCSACTVVPELLQPPSRQQHSGPGDVAPAAQAGAAAAAAAAASRQSGAKGPTATAAATTAAAAAAPEMPLLVLGSERGVTLLRVLVDDAALAEQQHLQALLQQAEEVRVSDAADAAKVPMQTGSTDAHDRGQQQQQQQWGSGRSRGRVTLQELSSSLPMFQGVVTKVSSSGSCVVAQESLGPVTAFRAVCVTPGGWVQLLSVGSDDRSKLVSADFVMQPAAALSVQGQASAGHGRTPAAGAAGAGEAAGDLAAAEQSPQQQEEDAVRNQAILVAVHPAGLMLLQRDLQEESQHVSSLMQAAQDAWETGQRPDDPSARGQGILLTRPGVSAQPWQGAGEAAPWAGMDGPRQQQGAQQPGWLGAEVGGQAAGPDAGRARLASEAAAAGGVAQTAGGLGAVRPDWLAFMNMQPGLAPAMLPSACCAPAPGTTLLCRVRLGLRPVGSEVADSSSSVLCLSATGGVGLAQLLPPEPAKLLQEWQQCAVIDAGAAGQRMQWTQGALAGSSAAGSTLRGLLLPDAVCSYEGYDRAPGALHAGLREAGRRQQEARGQPFGAVDGDLLFLGVHMHGASQRRDDTDALVLQQRLWQSVL